MNQDNIAYYNLGALEEIGGFGANGLVRTPRFVRQHLNERAKFIGMDSVGIEARFVTDAPNIDVYLSVLQPEFGARGMVRVYKSDFEVDVLEVEPGRVCNFRIKPPSEFACVNASFLAGSAFSPDVWRIVFSRSTYILHAIDTHGHSMRKPEKSELPRVDWLAYGSSITNSGLDGYAHVAARILGFQVQNFGFSGACFLEKELVDYMIDQREWDVISCELGVNMLGLFTPEEFAVRAQYLVQRLRQCGKPAFLLTAFPCKHTAGNACPPDELTRRDSAYRACLRRLAEDGAAKNIHLIHGEEILTDPHGLRADLVHPTTYGHAMMGARLAEKMKEGLYA